MKWLVSLSLVGAILGGIYPGAVFAFVCAAPSGSEIVVFIVNVLQGVAGAFLGMLMAKMVLVQTSFRRPDVIMPLVLGILCGIAGYLWAYWAISNADPPL
jgi:hypothetical protein